MGMIGADDGAPKGYLLLDDDWDRGGKKAGSSLYRRIMITESLWARGERAASYGGCVVSGYIKTGLIRRKWTPVGKKATRKEDDQCWDAKKDFRKGLRFL